ncbi:MAG: N(4)-(beta-N-acetylglucosaminyl)-L-asparaginase [Acidobacteria bacterium]|nr:N(4)-(beta-N-acetylglucosaminyl)-L-asparaginase [Acidobacteriota bacterium]
MAMNRRNFLKTSCFSSIAICGPDVGLSRAFSSSSVAASLPVVISSANRVQLADGSSYYGGERATAKAYGLIKGGADTLDAVIAGVNLVEDDPDDVTVGLGGLPNEEGEVELDASVMHGPSRSAGAVAALKYIKNPSRVAKLVMERTDHILLVGEGALRFALSYGFKKEDLLTDFSRRVWLKWREERSERDAWGPGKIRSVPEDETAEDRRMSRILRELPTGTINCLAVNEKGELSGVTTTSGLAWKVPGRVGDSPLIGCGLFVDNEVGAAGSTGRGEENIRIAGGHTVVENMRHGLSPQEACLDALKRIVSRYGGRPDFQISFYAVNKAGQYASASIWSGFSDRTFGIWNPARFAVTDAKGSRIEDCAYLYRRSPPPR